MTSPPELYVGLSQNFVGVFREIWRIRIVKIVSIRYSRWPHGGKMATMMLPMYIAVIMFIAVHNVYRSSQCI